MPRPSVSAVTLCVVTLVASLTTSLQAEVTLPAIFANHMVLQQQKPVPVWGTAQAGEKVTVSLSSVSVTATADDAGRWHATLPPMDASGPHEFTVTASNTVEIDDVWVGEVWLCSGQSNMAMTVSRARDFDQEQRAADLPQIRMFKSGTQLADEAQTDVDGQWTICTPDSVGTFSATGYFFARSLHQELNVPVGLVVSAVGGTPIDSWVREEAQLADDGLKPFLTARQEAIDNFDEAEALERFEKQKARWVEAVKEAKAAGKPRPRAPQDPVALFQRKNDLGGLYNGMIAPVIEYGMRGVIWYQGEANSTPSKARFYHDQLSLLVRDWRAQHNDPNLPIAWAQLPSFGGSGRNWPLVREAMLKATSLPHTGMAVTLDLGETRDIHPKNKQDVGRRLAQWALADVYDQDVDGIGPRVDRVQFTGDSAIISFQHAADGLTLKDFEPSLSGFAVAGSDKKWHPATAAIIDRQLVVQSSAVSDPQAVRYAWANDPPTLLYGASGLPASPFRTDDWSDVEPFDQR